MSTFAVETTTSKSPFPAGVMTFDEVQSLPKLKTAARPSPGAPGAVKASVPPLFGVLLRAAKPSEIATASLGIPQRFEESNARRVLTIAPPPEIAAGNPRVSTRRQGATGRKMVTRSVAA